MSIIIMNLIPGEPPGPLWAVSTLVQDQPQQCCPWIWNLYILIWKEYPYLLQRMTDPTFSKI